MLPPAASMRLDCFLFARSLLIILLDEQSTRPTWAASSLYRYRYRCFRHKTAPLSLNCGWIVQLSMTGNSDSDCAGKTATSALTALAGNRAHGKQTGQQSAALCRLKRPRRGREHSATLMQYLHPSLQELHAFWYYLNARCLGARRQVSHSYPSCPLKPRRN